jgi:hypothetical protein
MNPKRVFDALGPRHIVVALDGAGHVPQIFDPLLGRPYHQLYGIRPSKPGFPTRRFNIHYCCLSGNRPGGRHQVQGIALRREPDGLVIR